MTWNADSLPDQTGRVVLVTGANAGLGYFSSEQLARAGAHVIMSGRNPNRLAASRAAIGRRVDGASVETLLLDTSNLGSVRAAAASARAADRANADRVAAEQRAINERTNDDYETRLAAARAHAERLRLAAPAATGSGPGRTASVPGVRA